MKAYGSAWRGEAGLSDVLFFFFLLLPFLLSLESQIAGNLQDPFPRRLRENLAVAAAWSAADPSPASLWGSPGSFVAVRSLLVARHRKTNIVLETLIIETFSAENWPALGELKIKTKTLTTSS